MVARYGLRRLMGHPAPWVGVTTAGARAVATRAAPPPLPVVYHPLYSAPQLAPGHRCCQRCHAIRQTGLPSCGHSKWAALQADTPGWCSALFPSHALPDLPHPRPTHTFRFPMGIFKVIHDRLLSQGVILPSQVVRELQSVT